MGDPKRYEYEELDDLLAAEDSADNALITVAEEEELLGELKDLDDERVKEMTEAETDAELAQLEATLAEGEKEEEEEEDLDAQLADLNEEQNLTASEEAVQFAELEAEAEEADDDTFAIPEVPNIAAPKSDKGWFHRSTGFSTSRIPGWTRMRTMTGWGRKTRKRRKARKPRKTRRKRKARKTRRKRKVRKQRKTRKKRKARRNRRRRR